MVDWQIKRLLGVFLGIQLALLGLLGLAALGFDIPVLRQLVGFIYLTFIPGLLILRILRLHRLGTVETLLYSVGLSIAFVMFLGFFMNMLYPLIGISEPMSLLPLIATMTIAIVVLGAIAYLRDKDFSAPSNFDIASLFSSPALFLFLLPLLSILGTYLVNFYQNNILLLVVIALIALVAVLVAFNRFIPSRLYPLAVVMVAFSILWHWSLTSQYLTGWDIHIEYYYQNLAIANSFWENKNN